MSAYVIGAPKTPRIKSILKNSPQRNDNSHGSRKRKSKKKRRVTFQEPPPKFPAARDTLSFDDLPTVKLVSACMGGKSVNTEGPSQITRNMFVGNAQDAQNLQLLKTLKIKCIINVTSSHPQTRGFKNLVIRVSDEAGSDIARYFDETNSFIDTAAKRDWNVLIHCIQGVSRSCSVALAYLVGVKNMYLYSAMEWLRLRRIQCNPNCGFLLQLAKYEIRVFGRSSVAVPALSANSIWAMSYEWLEIAQEVEVFPHLRPRFKTVYFGRRCREIWCDVMTCYWCC